MLGATHHWGSLGPNTRTYVSRGPCALSAKAHLRLMAAILLHVRAPTIAEARAIEINCLWST